MITTFSHLLGLAEMAVKSQKTSRKTNARAASGKCLLCESVAARRGLCIKHYGQFRARRNERSSTRDQAQFEINCIEAGKILPQQAIRRLKGECDFDGVE